MEPISFWHINIGQVATWAMFIITVVLAAARVLRTFNKLDNTVEQITSQLTALSVKVEVINQQGTAWSQKKVGVELELAQSNIRRVEVLEQWMLHASPQISAIAADIGWIKHNMQKNGHAAR